MPHEIARYLCVVAPNYSLRNIPWNGDAHVLFVKVRFVVAHNVITISSRLTPVNYVGCGVWWLLPEHLAKGQMVPHLAVLIAACLRR